MKSEFIHLHNHSDNRISDVDDITPGLAGNAFDILVLASEKLPPAAAITAGT